MESPHICIQTSFFQIEPGEDEETNPGIYGRALAHWLAEQFKARGEPVEKVLAEDWGWCVVLTVKPFLWLGCANINSSDEWKAFVTAETRRPKIFQRFFQQQDAEPLVNHAYQVLDEIMRQAPGVKKVWVEQA